MVTKPKNITYTHFHREYENREPVILFSLSITQWAFYEYNIEIYVPVRSESQMDMKTA